jgi:hypothetical protein
MIALKLLCYTGVHAAPKVTFYCYWLCCTPGFLFADETNTYTGGNNGLNFSQSLRWHLAGTRHCAGRAGHYRKV